MVFASSFTLNPLPLGNKLDKDLLFSFKLPIIGKQINIPNKIKFHRYDNIKEDGAWARLRFCHETTWAILIPTLVILLGAGLPFLQADFPIAGGLSPDDETQEVWN